MTTPLLGATEWTENQNQPHVPVNNLFRLLEVFASLVIASEMKDQPSGSLDEEEGDVFIVEPAGAGDWAGHDNEIAYYSNGLKFQAPREGMLAFIVAEQSFLQYSELPTAGAGWYPFDFASATSAPYDLATMITGAPTASQVVMRWVAPRAVTLPASLTGSYAKAGTAATAQTDFDIRKNGASIGTIRFAAAGTSASFIFATETTFNPGDVLTVVAPGSPDATLADVGITLVGER